MYGESSSSADDKMREDAGDRDLRDAQIVFGRVDEFVRLEPETVQPRVDFEMDLRGNVTLSRRVGEAQRERLRIPQRNFEFCRERVG